MDKKSRNAHVSEIKGKYKDRSYTTYLLRRTYREDGKVKQQTLGNLTSLPEEVIVVLRDMLRGEKYAPVKDAFEAQGTRLHGHVACVRAMLRKLDLHRMLDPEQSRMRDLVEAMIVARVVEPLSDLPTTLWWQNTTLPEDLGILDATEDDVYSAMDWVLTRQENVEGAMGRRHLGDGSMVLCDVSSGFVESNRDPSATASDNQGGRSGKKQVNYGLLLDPMGRPLGVEVYPGNKPDPMAVASHIAKIKNRYGLGCVVLTGDRGMATASKIRELKGSGWIEWTAALRSKELQALAKQGLIQPGLFSDTDIAEFISPDYPGERLIACRDLVLAVKLASERTKLLEAAQSSLEALQTRVENRRLRRSEKIAEALGRLKSHATITKYYRYSVGEGRFTFKKNEDSILRESALDGIRVIRTTVSHERQSAEEAVTSYKSVTEAQMAFRALGSMGPNAYPPRRHISARMRAHVFICMLAHYVEWHLREAWSEFVSDDEESANPATRLPGGNKRHVQDEGSVHSWRTLLADLGTVSRHTIRVPARPNAPGLQTVTALTPLQRALCDKVGCSLVSDSGQAQ